MTLKPSLRNLAKAALLFSLFLYSYTNISGCQNSIEPTYKEENIPYLVKQICKDEYGLQVNTQRTPNALWVYIPLSRILHKEYGVKEGKIFDEEIMDKLRNILNTIGRVFLSADRTPEFFALWASDINIGIDYTLIGSVLDIKKSYAGSIPITEANKRYVMNFKMAPEAIGDTEGKHLQLYDIILPDFLAQQMLQRISAQFQEEDLKKYFQLEKINGIFNNDTFIFEYSIKQTIKPGKSINITDKILNTITYCIKTYEFQSFSSLEIYDLVTQDKSVLNKAAILARPVN